mmetsp:Transcript_29301/g.49931  ORF Transcript_29301/g.49931 Transcript_29301/m.49931 type:complete len:250 (+) Transcript_29301:500-1249(+)
MMFPCGWLSLMMSSGSSRMGKRMLSMSSTDAGDEEEEEDEVTRGGRNLGRWSKGVTMWDSNEACEGRMVMEEVGSSGLTFGGVLHLVRFFVTFFLEVKLFEGGAEVTEEGIMLAISASSLSNSLAPAPSTSLSCPNASSNLTFHSLTSASSSEMRSRWRFRHAAADSRLRLRRCSRRHAEVSSLVMGMEGSYFIWGRLAPSVLRMVTMGFAALSGWTIVMPETLPTLLMEEGAGRMGAEMGAEGTTMGG